MSQQGGLQARFRTIAGTSLDWNGDMIAAATAVTGISAGTANEHMFRLLKAITGSTASDLPGQQAVFAAKVGATNWGACGSDQFPSLAYDFTQGRTTLPSAITFSRSSSATYFDSSGVLRTASSNVARFDHNPSTLAPLGLLIEESRTNSIRNNTMAGAAAGTPGTQPTNWVTSGVAGTTLSIIGTGTQNGIEYIEYELTGTPSVTGSYIISFEGNTQVAASNGQTWAAAMYAQLVSGSLPSSLFLEIAERDAAGAAVAAGQTSSAITTAALRQQRISLARTLAGGVSTAFVTARMYFNLTSGVAVNVRWRVGLPQLEQGAFATSVIKTSSAAVTRSADVATINTLSPWFNESEFTVFVEGGPAYDAAASTGVLPVLVGFDDTTNNERVNFRRNNSNARDEVVVIDGGVVQSTLVSAGTNSWTGGTTKKMAAALKANDMALSTNGNTVFTDTLGTLPTCTRVQIGIGTGNAALNGHIKRLVVWPRRLPDAALQALTA